MSRQTYPVACECGRVHDVTGGQAGSSILCGCGKTVEVPVLSQLRNSVGQAALSPDVEIPTLMVARLLPFECDCALCGSATTDTLLLLATCERPSVKAKPGFWLSLVLLFLLPISFPVRLILMATGMSAANQEEPTGRHTQVRFPLRMCQPCAAEVSSWEVIREAMRRTPVYARLLDKFPDCQLATVKSL